MLSDLMLDLNFGKKQRAILHMQISVSRGISVYTSSVFYDIIQKNLANSTAIMHKILSKEANLDDNKRRKS